MMRTAYLCSTVRDNLRTYQRAAAILVFCLGWAWALFGLFLLGEYHLRHFALSLKEGGQFILYLTDPPDPAEVAALKQKLGRDRKIDSFTYISKEDALDLFKARGGDPALLTGLSDNPLPASFEVGVVDRQAVSELIRQYRRAPGVDEAEPVTTWQEGMEGTLGRFAGGGVVMVGLIAGLVIVMTTAAVRLYFQTRREEFQTMRLMGVPTRWIALPVSVEGGLIGAGSGVLAMGLLALGFEMGRNRIETLLAGAHLQFLPISRIVLVILAAGFVGAISALLSLIGTGSRRSPLFPVKENRSTAGPSWRVLPTLVLLLSLFAPAVDAAKPKEKEKPSSPSRASLTDRITQEEKALDRVRIDIHAKKEKEALLKKEEASLLAEMKEIDRRSERQRQKAAEIAQKVKEADAAKKSLDSEAKRQEAQVEKKRHALSKSLRALYRQTRLPVVTTARKGVFSRRENHDLQAVSRARKEQVADALKKQTALSEAREASTQTAASFARQKAVTTQLLSEVENKKDEKKIDLSRVRNERAAHEQSLAQLDGSALRLQQILKELEKTEETARRNEQKKRQVAQATSKKQDRVVQKVSRGDLHFAKAKGQLVWPQKGELVGHFGRQKHPKFDTYIDRKGIEIATAGRTSGASGGVVHAVYSGSVVYASSLQGYGKVVILDHGGNYSSVYAHLDELRVSSGDKITKEDVIGSVATPKRNLYFEIRHQGRPQNPMLWLASR